MNHSKMKISSILSISSLKNPGFTLPELVVAVGIGTIISFVTGSVLLDGVKSSARGEAIQRLREDWNRTTMLVESEISISNSVQSNNLNLSAVEAQDCPLLSQNSKLKMRIRLPGNLPDIIYGVQPISNLPSDQANQWIGDEQSGVLIRCGPQLTISPTGSGDYLETTPYQQSIILDDLDLSNNDGFKAEQGSGDSKLVRFELIMKANNISHANSSYKDGSGAFSRINEMPPVPEEKSICSKICTRPNEPCSTVANDNVITLTNSQPQQYTAPSKASTSANTTTICTNRVVRMSDSITGSDANYVIDANPIPSQNVGSGVIINGGINGRNILLGTELADTIEGGNFDDILVGRGGGDSLIGGLGNDSFLPWLKQDSSADASVSGGSGLDRLYINGESKDFAESAACTIAGCTITSSQGGVITMDEIEVVIYNDTARRLN